MRISKQKLNPFLAKEIKKIFAQLITDIRDEKEAALFLNDFFTVTENETFSKRLAVAYYLKKGRSYSNIKDNLKVSSATIAEVSDMMKKEGFELGVKKIEADEWASVWSERIKKIVGKKDGI